MFFTYERIWDGVMSCYSNESCQKKFLPIKDNKNDDPLRDKILKIDVPGFNKTNLDVYQDGEYLSIKGDNGYKNIDLKYSVGDIKHVKCSVVDGILYIEFSYKKNEGKKIPIE